MPTIYLATPKNSFIYKDELKEKNFNFIVIKKHNYKGINKLKNPISVDVLEKNYETSDKYLLSFKVEEFLAEKLQKYLESKQKDFLLENNCIDNDSIDHFFKFIQVNQDYDFEPLVEKENLEEQIISIATPELPENQSIAEISSNLLDKEHKDFLNNIPTPTSSRSNSVYSEDSKSIDESVNRRVSMQDDPHGKNAVENTKIPFLTEMQKNRLLFTEKNNSGLFKKIKNHGEKIVNGFFNGKEKSEILLSITTVAENINKSSTPNELEQNILALNYYINNEDNVKELSRYRGISQSIAGFFGYGNVTSKEYVEGLQNEFNPIIEEIFPEYKALAATARPTI